MNKKNVFFIVLLILCNIHLNAQKQIAITIDDPNTYQTPLLSWEDRNNLILETLTKHHINVALYVCGMRINNENGKLLLKKWDENNHLICNHSYSNE